ncbi:hypothetical protein RIEGSTA812A_PEG_876 [invertebrate metagenome]|uniref:Uncharacterized protein n=1 Tax=invertebrate metagenome TaxID=1711999 RepID=A0A484H995_9ZZZZ
MYNSYCSIKQIQNTLSIVRGHASNSLLCGMTLLKSLEINQTIDRHSAHLCPTASRR